LEALSWKHKYNRILGLKIFNCVASMPLHRKFAAFTALDLANATSLNLFNNENVKLELPDFRVLHDTTTGAPC
jgi:hypothetical protein